MHMRNVRIFCDVAGCRSFSKAAELHGISQPAISQAVHALEEDLHTTLIDRSKRPLDLTPAGRFFLDGVREILTSLQKLEQSVQEFENRVTGQVRVSAIYSVGLLQMDRIAKRFRELYPQARLDVEYVHPDEVYQHLLDESADLGVVSFPKDGGSFEAEPWKDQLISLITPANHPLAECAEIRLEELEGESYIAFTSELPIRQKMDRWLKKAGVSLKVVHEFDNIENIKRDVEIGSGVALLPLETVQRELELGLLRAVKLADVQWLRPLGIVYRRKRKLSAAARKFVELLKLESPESHDAADGAEFRSRVATAPTA